VTTDYIPGRRAGKRGARESHEERLMLSLFRPKGPTDVYSEWDGSHGITVWGMDGNDEWSDCGAAAPDHGNMAKANNVALLGTLGQPKYAGTLPTYWAYGLSQGETGTPPAQPNQPDQGVTNNSWLGWLYTEGIIDGYGEVPLDELDSYAQDFNGLLLGLELDDDAESDFEASPPIPWGSSPGDTPDPQEGHDTWLIKLHADGSGSLITWGGLQPFTLDFRQQNITDAWAILDAEDAKRTGVNWAALQGALQAIHGTG
jgi:hypothetical protein